MSFFNLKECHTAEELMAYLDPNHEYWGITGYLNHWLFRGQGDASWSLLPSAWRYRDSKSKINLVKKRFGDLKYVNPDYPVWPKEILKPEQMLVTNSFIELTLLFLFAETCNQQGFYVPDYSTIRNMMRRFAHLYYEGEMNAFELENMKFWNLDFAALAQHHGIPTRLLDWTYSGRKAAYFAIEQQDPDAKEIAVFALLDSIALVDGIDFPQSVNLITAARYHDDFINAQEGVFTCDESGNEIFKTQENYPDLESTLIGRGYKEHRLMQGVKVLGYKFTLPAHQAGKLRQLLRRENIHKASLMPTYDNVAKQTLLDVGI